MPFFASWAAAAGLCIWVTWEYPSIIIPPPPPSSSTWQRRGHKKAVSGSCCAQLFPQIFKLKSSLNCLLFGWRDEKREREMAQSPDDIFSLEFTYTGWLLMYTPYYRECEMSHMHISIQVAMAYSSIHSSPVEFLYSRKWMHTHRLFGWRRQSSIPIWPTPISNVENSDCSKILPLFILHHITQTFLKAWLFSISDSRIGNSIEPEFASNH